MSLSRRCTTPGRSGVADARDLRVPGEQALHHGAGVVARAGVHHQPRRLVDDQDVVVGVDDRDLDVGLGHERPPGRRRGRRRPRSRRPRRAGPTGWWPPRRCGGIRPASSHSLTWARLAPVTMATTRSMRSPSRGPGTVSATPTSGLRRRRRWDRRPARRRRRPAPARCRRRDRGGRLATTSRTAPTTTPTSATLNTGHHWRSMKSTTEPLKNPPPPERKARSSTLPSAPPTIIPRATTVSREVTLRACHTSRPTMTRATSGDPAAVAAAHAERRAGVVGEVEAEASRPRRCRGRSGSLTAQLLESWSSRSQPRATAANSTRWVPGAETRDQPALRWEMVPTIGEDGCELSGARTRRPCTRRAHGPTGSPSGAPWGSAVPETSQMP